MSATTTTQKMGGDDEIKVSDAEVVDLLDIETEVETVVVD
jgi:hypothetical protein